jgi:hypothetical protein
VVNRILLAAGLDVNATSISDANTDLDAKVNLAIPQFGDKIPKSYASYLGLIMQSTVGYVFQNSDTNEMHYNLFAAPVAGDVLLSSEIINLSVSLEIADMAESVRAYNEGNFYKHQEFVSAPPFVVSVSVSSTKSKYFHGIDNQVSVESCLALPYYTATRRIELARNEQMTVNVEVASKFMNKNIGDDISIADDRIPGTKTVVNGYSCSLMKIIGIRYGVESLIFTCINVRND